MVWNELKQVHTAGLSAYFGDLWNRIDATMIVLYFSTLAFRAASYLSHRLKTGNSMMSNYTSNSTNFSSGLSSDSVLGSGGGAASADESASGTGLGVGVGVGVSGAVASTSNYESDDGSGIVWQYWDLLFLSEGVFALANIFSFMRLVTLATLSQHIGPMQISLSRMVKDVMKFMFIFFLVLLSFACGLHQLNWFFKTDCKHSDPAADYSSGVGGVCRDGSDKKAFDSLLMAMRTLFWALFNLSPPPNNIETSIPNNKSTPIIMFIVEAMYASYYVTAVIVLLRMLVAMMTTSYRDIESRADVEWKYARSKLWMTYIEEGSTLPPPVNLLPSMKWVTRVILQIFTGRFWKCSHFTQLCFKDTDKLEEQRRKDEYNYRKLIEKLIGRYRKEKARVNLIYPEETEEIGKSIVVLHTENRRLVSLIQRLTKDSEEHAKNWYYDYNVRNTYLNNNGSSPNPLNNHSSSSANHYHSTSFGGNPHDVNVKRRINSSSVAGGGNPINYCNHLGMSPTGVELATSVDDENSLIHRYNGQVRTGRLFAADDQEEVIVETDMSSCDSPVRQVFCQSGSSVDEGEAEGDEGVAGAGAAANAGESLLSGRERDGAGGGSNPSKGLKDGSGTGGGGTGGGGVVKDETRV